MEVFFIMGRKNKKTKSVGNGEGSLYYSETLGRWIFQYYDTQGKRQTMKQKKKESVKDFKARATQVKNELNTGTYIAKSTETVVTIAEQYIKNKHADGITSDRSYARDLETLEQIKKTCPNFCNLSIQNVTIKHLEEAKKEIKEYANSTIDKIWCLLGKVFSIACSPSRKILIYNLMLDETLKKPISVKKTKKVKPLNNKELEKLNSILDNEERTHPYRNIVKMQGISGMRIGEVLARSKEDYNKTTKQFNVHNTLTQDEKYHVILGKHTKTYNKKTQIDEGQRYLPLDNNLFRELVEIIEEQQKNIPPVLDIQTYDYTPDFNIPHDKHSAAFDTGKLLHPLSLRLWQQGDSFVPFGMKGTKKVSDYLTDRKFSLAQKEQQWVLCCGEDIIWLVGERSDNRFRVNDATQSITIVTLRQPNE